MLLLGVALAQSTGYYPHGLGFRWAYSSGETQALVKERGAGQASGSIWKLEHLYGRQVRFADLIQYGVSGVWLLGVIINGRTIDYQPALKLYPAAPLRVGEQWSSQVGFEGLYIAHVSQVLKVEGINTPVGRFNAFVVRSSLSTDTGGGSVVDMYFVPGVGVVRYATPGGEIINLTALQR